MQCKEYFVKAGDTLYSLARENGVTVEEILAINKGIEPTKLVVGSVLCIPQKDAIMNNPDADLPEGVKPVDETLQTVYKVKAGDTLRSIAKNFHITVEQLLFANPNINPGYIEPGSELKIPKADVPIPGSVRYVIKGGEGLLDVLKKFDIGYGRLKLYNPNTDLTKLEEGMIIFVPEVFGGDGAKCKIGNYAYTVQEGDTIDSIAEKFDISPKSINAFEGALKTGTVICLPLKIIDDKM